VGTFISAGGEVDVELAFLAGLERFEEMGFALGDPAAFLHPPGHPHLHAPRFGRCDGCSPPVHGTVALLRSAPAGGGAVQAFVRAERSPSDQTIKKPPPASAAARATAAAVGRGGGAVARAAAREVQSSWVELSLEEASDCA